MDMALIHLKNLLEQTKKTVIKLEMIINRTTHEYNKAFSKAN